MKKLAALSAIAVLALAAAATALASSKAMVGTAKTSLGTALVAANGHTLYLLTGETSKKLVCTGACLTYWPPLMTSGKATVSGSAKSSLLGTVKRGSGEQVTYDGHPIYTYAADSKAGEVMGQGVKDGKSVWYAVAPSGSAITSSAKTTASTTAAPSSGW